MCAEFKDLASIIGEEKLKEKMAQMEGEKPVLKDEEETGAASPPKEKALVEGSIIRDKYKVLKILTKKKNRATYLVRDTKITEKKFVIREIIPPAMEREDLKARIDKFQEIVRILSTFKHKNLAEVYEGFTESNRVYYVMEYVEGLDLRRLINMSTTPFAKEKVVEWGLKMCDALEFLHYRPKPFTLGDLGPTKIMVDADGELNIISYDLQRFFDLERTMEFMPDSPQELYEDITKLSRILYYLLTKKKYNDFDFERAYPQDITPKMEKLLEIGCNSSQKSYGDVKDYKKRLEDSLTAEEEFTRKRSWVFPLHTIKIDLVALYRNTSDKFISQHPFTIGVEVVFVVVLILYLLSVSARPVYNRPKGVDLAYVFGGDSMFTIDLSSYEIIDQRELGFKSDYSLPVKINSFRNLQLTPSQRKRIRKLAGNNDPREVLFISQPDKDRLQVMDIEKNVPIGSIKTDGEPSIIVSDDKSKNLFILHRKNSTVSRLSLDKMVMENIFPTIYKPEYLTFIPLDQNELEKYEKTHGKDETTDKKEEGSINGKTAKMDDKPSSSLAITNIQGGRIEIINSESGRVKYRNLLEGYPGKMILSKDTSALYILDVKNNQLVSFNLQTQKMNYDKIESAEVPTDMALDSLNQKMWFVVTKSNSLIPYDVNQEKFEEPITIRNQPISISFYNDKLWILNRGSKDLVVTDYTGKVERKISLHCVPRSISFIEK